MKSTTSLGEYYCTACGAKVGERVGARVANNAHEERMYIHTGACEVSLLLFLKCDLLSQNEHKAMKKRNPILGADRPIKYGDQSVETSF